MKQCYAGIEKGPVSNIAESRRFCRNEQSPVKSSRSNDVDSGSDIQKIRIKSGGIHDVAGGVTFVHVVLMQIVCRPIGESEP